MCAAIAAGTRSSGGRFDGIAPDASLIACKTFFYDTELTAIYDYLIALLDANPNLRIVATNSFGLQTGTPPGPPPNLDFPDALSEAVGRGIPVFFSAGNSEKRCFLSVGELSDDVRQGIRELGGEVTVEARFDLERVGG